LVKNSKFVVTKPTSMEIKRILFPTDFSPNSLNGLSFLRAICSATDAEVHLLHAFHHHVVDPSIAPHKFEAKAKEEQDRARARLNALAQSLETDAECPLKKCYSDMRIGFADDEIIHASREKNIDLIIMGTKGATGLQKIILGSVASEVINEADCPVLAVPEDASYKGISHIVFATDLDKEDFPEIKRVGEFARLFESNLTVLHIKQKEYSEMEKELKDFESGLLKHVQYDKVKFRFIRSSSKVEGIDLFLKENEADLLAMVTHKRKLFRGLFKRSLTKQIAHQARIPLLAFHAKDKT
jgi:nucleotide-binding universal stress UspA family protein